MISILSTPEFWVAVAFLGFAGLIFYYRLPQQIVAALDQRSEEISRELDEARRLREEAQTILADYERKQRNTQSEADEILLQARREAQALATEARKAFEEAMVRRSKIAEDKIARAERQAVVDVRRQTIEIAVAAAETLINKKITPAAASKLIDESIINLKINVN